MANLINTSPPPPKKKIYIYIYILQHPPALSQRHSFIMNLPTHTHPLTVANLINTPPPQKKIYIYIYISRNTPLPYHSGTVSSWTYPLLILSLPMPTYILQSMKTVDMISCHSKVQTSEPFNPLTPMSDQDWISPYYFKPTSSRQVMRIKKDIN